MFKLDEKDIEEIEKHYDKYFTMAGAKNSETVLHEIVSDDMHIDLIYYLPTEKFPYYIFATIGMSGYKMEGAPFENTELIMFLPKDWKIKEVNDENWYWPIRLLKQGARLPYLCDSFLSFGHTFSADEDNTPFAGCTDMCSGFITLPTLLDTGVFELKYNNGKKEKKVNFFCLTSLNGKELKEVRRLNGEELFDYSVQADLVVKNKR